MKKGRTAAEINFAETARIRYELVQVKGRLAQLQREHEIWDKLSLVEIATERDKLRAELATVDEALGEFFVPNTEDHGIYRLQSELAAVKAVAKTWFKKAMRHKRELNRVRQDAQDQSDEAQALWLSPCEAEELRRQLEQMTACRDYWYKKTLAAESERNEIRQAAQELRRQAKVEQERPVSDPGHTYNEWWYESAKRFKKERDELQAELDQMRQSTFQEIMSLRAELMQARVKLNRMHLDMQDQNDEAQPERLRVHLASERRLQERLTTLDAAEAALADCGIGGIFAGFDGLPDAIEQMAHHIRELTQGPVEVEMTDAEIGEALQTERQLRQEAEQELKQRQRQIDLLSDAELRAHQAGRRAENLQQEKVGIHEVLDECQIPRNYDDSKPASARTRILWLNQRAEELEHERDEWRGDWESATAKLLDAEAERGNGHLALTAAGVPRSDASGYKHSIAVRVVRLRKIKQHTEALHPVLVGVHKALDEYRADAYDDSTANARTRIARLGQRAECAEALAALVNEKTANLLVLLASTVKGSRCTATVEDARDALAVAAQIREALDDSQA